MRYLIPHDVANIVHNIVIQKYFEDKQKYDEDKFERAYIYDVEPQNEYINNSSKEESGWKIEINM